MTKRCFNIILCITALVCGGTLYVLLRPHTHLANCFDKINIIKNIQNQLSVYELNFCRYYFADFLWAFSLNCGLLSIFSVSGKSLLLCSIATLSYGVVWELFQYIKLTSGVADILDITMYLLAVFASATINLKGLLK